MVYFHYNALVNALASTLFGIAAFWKNPRDPKNRIYAFYCLSLALWSYCYVGWQLSSDGATALFYVRCLMMGAILIPIAHFHHLLALFEWQSPKILRVGYVLCVIFLISNFTPLFIARVEPRLTFPYWPVPGPFFHPYLAGFFFFLSYSLVIIYRARIKAEGYERNLLSWVFWVTIIGYGGGATNFPLWYGIPFSPFGNCLVSLYTTTVFYILSRYRLMEIGIIVRKTLIYSAVMGSLTAVYMAIVGLFTQMFQGLTGYQTIFSSAIAAGLITLFFQPLRKRIQGFVDQKFFRQYVDREEKLYELSREVVTHTTPEAMAEALMRVLTDTLHPKSGALYLRTRDGSGFSAVSPWGNISLPPLMSEENPLTSYFLNHPQPFIQDAVSELGSPQSTRRSSSKERQ
jgi:hypothetical protein